jgi:hypothetical protein
MRHWIIPVALIAAAIGASPLGAQPLPGDHVIVPGVRIGAAELAPADQGSLLRELGEPNETQHGAGHEIYRYGPPHPDGASADELVVDFDVANDQPFEISTAFPLYRTKDGLGVGSDGAAVRASLGAPLCEGGDGKGDGVIVYGTIWFLIARGQVAKVSIREHLSRDDFRSGTPQCR